MENIIFRYEDRPARTPRPSSEPEGGLYSARGGREFSLGVANSRASRNIRTMELYNAALILLVVASALADNDEACETLPSEIHITKEEFDDLGRLQRTCSGDIAVNKCEGACNSQVQPSVITPTGFLKECYCCRESFLRERTVRLEHCYDPDGVRLSQGRGTMDVRLREPADCKCYKCSDYTR